MNWLAQVHVVPKEEVLDPQGEAILGALRHLDFTGVTAVRSGRLFELHIANDTEDGAMETATEAARRLLSNPVVETFRLTIMPDPAMSEAAR